MVQTRQPADISTVAIKDCKQARKPRGCIPRAPASKAQFALLDTLWADYAEAASAANDLSKETWLVQNFYTTSLNELDASGILSLTIRLVNATAKARLLQAGELFYDCSSRDQSDATSL
ncbi:hypothetical protein AX760_11360 [Pararhizobium antarcticum]|uniref:Uncharacterized protein n=1 Tax=Pararhizobium antarcticum TaxID=1798805 RepID=A0A657M0Q3_9HYPH|nr:hypothetical protein AX761_06185 [Rhizobium sp. 58]OJF99975.1 hypothetical protein AX760_11360 [Pararhizobium antarcticum]